METSDVRAATPVPPEDHSQYPAGIESLELATDQIDKRAFTRTEILNRILEQDTETYWHHGGLNE